MKLPPRNYRNRSGREALDKVRSEKHRKWVRTFLCILWERNDCFGRVDCCHIKTGNGANNRSKAGDQHTVPMCRKHHSEQTRIGEGRFEMEYSINLNAQANAFAAQSPFLKSQFEKKYANAKEVTPILLNAPVGAPKAQPTDAGAGASNGVPNRASTDVPAPPLQPHAANKP